MGLLGDYVEAMYLMMQHKADDWVVATGETHTVKEFASIQFIRFNWNKYVETSEKYYRPNEVGYLLRHQRQRKLSWEPKLILMN